MSPRNGMLLVCLLSMIIIIGGCGSIQGKPTNVVENYPIKPITVIVPFSAGGSADMLARSMEKLSSQYLGQNMVVVNKPGGAATIGWNELIGAPADGYTLGITAVGLIMQPLYGQTKYDYSTALEPLAQVAVTPMVAVVQAAGSWQNLNDLITYAKQNPGKIKFGHAGLGTVPHVVGEMFAKEAGIQIEQVPFRGGTEGIAALLGGHIKLLFVTPAEIKEHVKSGKVRVLAVSDTKRLTKPEFVNVPTFKEQGLDVVFYLWQGIGVPKGLPNEVENKLAAGIKGIVNDPDFKKNLEDLGMDVEYLGPKESVDKWISDKVRLTKIVKETGLAERIASQKN